MHAPGMCPWSGFAPANLHFCERDLCAWVTQPANTWSNLGFLVAGVVVIWASRREHAPRAGWLGPIAILTGFASAAFHGTGTLFGQMLDQGVMFLETSLFITLNIARLKPLSVGAEIAAYAALVVGSTALLLLFTSAGIALFIAQVVVFLLLELAAAFRYRKQTRYRALIAAGITFALSYALWWFDKLGVMCNPDNHISTGHSAWHLLGALSFWFWYRHYAQLEQDRFKPPTATATELPTSRDA